MERRIRKLKSKGGGGEETSSLAPRPSSLAPDPSPLAPRTSQLFPLLAGAVPLALYASTMAPTVYGVDSAELSTAAYLLGISHPPGAPAYLIIGHLFTWLPFGDVGYRLNLLSAVAAALSIVLVYDVVRRLGGTALLSLATAWFVATGYYVWASAVAAEVYSLQGFVALAMIELALVWRQHGTGRTFLALCLLAGLGLGVHPSLALLLPGVGVLVSRRDGRPWRCPRLVLGGALCGLAGAAVYAYLPLRHRAALPLDPARDYWGVDLASWRGLWWMVSGRGFAGQFYRLGEGGVLGEIGRYAHRLWSNFLGLGALLGLLGLAVTLIRRPRVHGALAIMLLGYLGFYLFYGAADKEMMFLPAYLLWGVWVGLGAAALFDRLGSPMLAPLVLLALGVSAVALNHSLLDVSSDRSARERGEAILAALENDAIYFGSWGDLRLVEYLQQVENRRRDIEPVDLVFADTEARRRRMAQALSTGRPVYVAECRRVADLGLRCIDVPGCACGRLIDVDR